jgi:hypothetical protein
MIFFKKRLLVPLFLQFCSQFETYRGVFKPDFYHSRIDIRRLKMSKKNPFHNLFCLFSGLILVLASQIPANSQTTVIQFEVLGYREPQVLIGFFFGRQGISIRFFDR